jgi:hypothetical protein
MLNSSPGTVQYWNGTAWANIGGGGGGYDGPWTSFTPTFSAGITALGNATINFRYKLLNANTVALRFRLTMGTTTTVDAGIVSLASPVGTPYVDGTLQTVGSAFGIMTTRGNGGLMRMDGTGLLQIFLPPSTTSSQQTAVVGTNLATGNNIGGEALYEIV